MNRFYCIHCVADIFIYKLSATGICNTIIIYLSGYYSYFIAGGRSMLYFSTFIEVYLKRTEAIRSFTKFSIFSVVEYKETCLTCFRAEQHRELPNQYWTSFILYRLHTHYITLINHFLMSIEDRKIISIQFCITP